MMNFLPPLSYPRLRLNDRNRRGIVISPDKADTTPAPVSSTPGATPSSDGGGGSNAEVGGEDDDANSATDLRRVSFGPLLLLHAGLLLFIFSSAVGV